MILRTYLEAGLLYEACEAESPSSTNGTHMDIVVAQRGVIRNISDTLEKDKDELRSQILHMLLLHFFLKKAVKDIPGHIIRDRGKISFYINDLFKEKTKITMAKLVEVNQILGSFDRFFQSFPKDLQESVSKELEEHIELIKPYWRLRILERLTTIRKLHPRKEVQIEAEDLFASLDMAINGRGGPKYIFAEYQKIDFEGPLAKSKKPFEMDQWCREREKEVKQRYYGPILGN